MKKYRVVQHQNINSDGRTRTQETVITARTLRSAKQQASAIFPTKGHWYQCEQIISGGKTKKLNEYGKGQGNLIGGDRLFLIPLET